MLTEFTIEEFTCENFSNFPIAVPFARFSIFLEIISRMECKLA